MSNKIYHEKVGLLWSGPLYNNYKKSPWPWYNLPFMDNYTERRTVRLGAPRDFVMAKSIVEIGSAMGNGYKYLRESGKVELSGYVGFDISADGQKYCRETYPEARWIEADLSLYDLQERFEYSFERHAIHHMPRPLEQIRKVLSVTERAACLTFRGRVRGETFSDLDRSFFNHFEDVGFAASGRVFLNLINVLEVVSMARELGFNHIGMIVGLHEPIQSEDPTKLGMFLDADVKQSGGEVLRFSVLFAREPRLAQPLVYANAGARRVWLSPDFHRLRWALREYGR